MGNVDLRREDLGEQAIADDLGLGTALLAHRHHVLGVIGDDCGNVEHDLFHHCDPSIF